VFAPGLHHVIETPDRPAFAPQHEQRTRHLLRAIRIGVIEIDRRAGAIVLARRVNRRRILEAAQVLGERLVGDGTCAARQPLEARSQVILRAVADQRLGKRRRLNQEEPVEVLRGELARHHRVGQRHNVEDRCACDPLGVLDAHAPRHASAAIVADDGEALVPEGTHDFDLIERHRPLGIVGVVLAVWRFTAVAVATQISHDDGEALRECWRDLVPLDVRLRIAVDQQERRSTAAYQRMNHRAGGLDAAGRKAGKEPRRLRVHLRVGSGHRGRQRGHEKVATVEHRTSNL
jgi:hypothetical protein